MNIWTWFKSFFTPPPVLVAQPPADNFSFALTYTLRNEGGFSNLADDTPTNFGITQADLSKWRGYQVSVDEVRNMFIDEATVIYRAWYWNDIGLNLIKNRAIATAIFDQGVLSGTRTAINYAQVSANNCGANLIVDGVIGTHTCAFLEAVNAAKFMLVYYSILKEHFTMIVKTNPAKQVFYDGWINRANRLLNLI